MNTPSGWAGSSSSGPSVHQQAASVAFSSMISGSCSSEIPQMQDCISRTLSKPVLELPSKKGKLQPAVDKAAAAIRGGRSAEHVAVVGKPGGNVPETLIDPVARRCNERGAHASSVRLRIERISSFSDAWSAGGRCRIRPSKNRYGRCDNRRIAISRHLSRRMETGCSITAAKTNSSRHVANTKATRLSNCCLCTDHLQTR